MSESATILEGPDGRLYEIPADELSKYAVPGNRVQELRRKMATAQAPAAAASPHGPPPPDAPPKPPEVAGSRAPNGAQSMTIPVGNGGVTLNFFFADAAAAAGAGASAGTVDGYHMTFDDNGIPVNHTEMLYGDYIDKQGSPAVGWHSHDPVSGNAQ